MKKIYYIGDWAVQMGPMYAGSAFEYSEKGTAVINYGTWLKSALESDGRYHCESVPAWEFYMLGPGEWEKILDEYDIIVFSDVEARSFQLAPDFFKKELFGTTILTFPDRIRLTVEAVHAGKSVIFMGGWISFAGDAGKGGWGRTQLKEILPVTCLEFTDMVESTEGYTPKALMPDHPILKGVDLSSAPPILGYNEVKPRAGYDLLAIFSETGDPCLAAGNFGKGRVVAYMSDPAPHWGCNFVFWDQYKRLWLNAADWVITK